MDAYKDFTTEDIDKLEEFIDKFGIKKTMAMLSELCFHKAEHVASNWQDSGLADIWEHIGDKINYALEDISQTITTEI